VAPTGLQGERQIAARIAKAGGQTISGLGLRFDRVVIRVLSDLRRFADGRTPAGATVVLTLTAPIRTPAKTATALEQKIAKLLRVGLGAADRRVKRLWQCRSAALGVTPLETKPPAHRLRP
jgi:hypothetical protein